MPRRFDLSNSQLRLLSPLSALLFHRSSILAHAINLPDRLVLETLGPLPKDRKCFRMINGVLVERTVKDVIPALETNADGLKKVLDDLVKSYKLKQDELETWKVRSSRFYGGCRCTPDCVLTLCVLLSFCRRRIMSRWCSLEYLLAMRLEVGRGGRGGRRYAVPPLTHLLTAH